MGAFCRALAAAGLLACLSASSALSTSNHATTRVLTYRSPQALKTLLARTGFKVERNLPALHAVEVSGSAVGSRLAILKGSEFVRRFFLGVVLLLIIRFAWELSRSS